MTLKGLSVGFALLAGFSATGTLRAGAVDIGSRLELFLDDFLVESRSGGLEFVLHHPVPRETALVHDAPWEGSGSGYHSVFRDGDRYRMYYKAWHLDLQPGANGKARLNTASHPLYTCYAESADGVHWRKPSLGIVEFRGSKDNNIVLASGEWQGVKIDAGHIALARDENPDAAPDAKYKGLVLGQSPRGLLAFKSPDGIHWSPMRKEPVITAGAFDSQNLAFWDGARGCYRAYWRIFTAGATTEKEWKPAGHRAIRTASSKDFLHWENQRDVVCAGSPSEQLYTNVVKPYPGAAHLLIGFPTRYVERGWSGSMRALPERGHREMRSSVTPRYGTAITEGLLMSSRDGVAFHRWNKAFLRPGPERDGTWNYGQQYIAWHLVETASGLPGEPDEFSLYAGESYWTGNSSELRRYSIRRDGFVSAHALMSGGELLTKELRYSGKHLLLNFSTSAAGSLRVEIQDAAGGPVTGFALEDCEETFGDALQRRVQWKGGDDVGAAAGRAVRLRFVMKDADLYSFRFAE